MHAGCDGLVQFLMLHARSCMLVTLHARSCMLHARSCMLVTLRARSCMLVRVQSCFHAMQPVQVLQRHVLLPRWDICPRCVHLLSGVRWQAGVTRDCLERVFGKALCPCLYDVLGMLGPWPSDPLVA